MFCFFSQQVYCSSNIMGESGLEDTVYSKGGGNRGRHGYVESVKHITAASNIVIQIFQYNFGTHFHDKPLMNHPFPQLHCFDIFFHSVSMWSSKVSNITEERTTRARSLTRRRWSFQGSSEETPRYRQSSQNSQFTKEIYSQCLSWWGNGWWRGIVDLYDIYTVYTRV